MPRHLPSHSTLRSTLGRLALLVALTACAQSAQEVETAGTPTSRVDRSMLTKQMLSNARFSTAYEAVESLRSNWLHTRGPDSFQRPSVVRVYLDNVSLGDVQTLRTIAIQNVEYMRFFDGPTATARWGLDHGSGAIFVSTRPIASDP